MKQGIHVHLNIPGCNLKPYENLRPIVKSHVDYIIERIRDGSICPEQSPLLVMVEGDCFRQVMEKTHDVTIEGYILNGNHRFNALKILGLGSWEARVFNRDQLTIYQIIGKTLNADEETFQILPEPWEGLLKRFRTVAEHAEYASPF